MTTTTHDFREISLRIGRRIGMSFTAELFQCQSRFIYGTRRRMLDIFPKNRKSCVVVVI